MLLQFNTSSSVKYIMILGAGASADYGLPLWSDLSELILDEIYSDLDNVYRNKNEIIDWISKVGPQKDYKTIDECIKHESINNIYHRTGHKIEDEIFSILRKIFIKNYKENYSGWITNMNKKILNNRNQKLESKIAFINYNYDNILNNNFLNFEFLPQKQRMFTYKDEINHLSSVSVKALYPHGNLFKNEYSPHIEVVGDTMKSGVPDFLDAVSCYESGEYIVQTYDRSKSINICILGLGGGLDTNLSKLKFGNPVSEIHVTIKDVGSRDNILQSLSRIFGKESEEIKVYDSCDDLISNCLC